MLRLHETAPVQPAVKEALVKVRTSRGKAKATWLSTENQDLKKPNINHQVDSKELEHLAEERQAWMEKSKAQC